MGVEIHERIVESEADIELMRTERLPGKNDMEIALEVCEMSPERHYGIIVSAVNGSVVCENKKHRKAFSITCVNAVFPNRLIGREFSQLVQFGVFEESADPLRK